MEIKILQDEKNELEFQIDNQTTAELVRIYLNEDDSVKLAVWKKEHYSKPLIMKIVTEGKSAKRSLADAVSKIKKELDKYKEEFKRAVK